MPIKELRSFIIENISHHGEPLRWAITKASRPDTPSNYYRDLQVEAVVITYY